MGFCPIGMPMRCIGHAHARLHGHPMPGCHRHRHAGLHRHAHGRLHRHRRGGLLDALGGVPFALRPLRCHAADHTPKAAGGGAPRRRRRTGAATPNDRNNPGPLRPLRPRGLSSGGPGRRPERNVPGARLRRDERLRSLRPRRAPDRARSRRHEAHAPRSSSARSSASPRRRTPSSAAARRSSTRSSRSGPTSPRAPTGDGWIVGDMHLENVGAYRNDADEVVFGLNDFDDATIGPLRFDVLRLSTSVLLAGRGLPGARARRRSRSWSALVAAYLKAPRRRRARRAVPAPVARPRRAGEGPQQEGAARRARARRITGRRRFVARRSLPRPAARPRRARARAARRLRRRARRPRARARPSTWKVEDAAFRVAGNGSLGRAARRGARARSRRRRAAHRAQGVPRALARRALPARRPGTGATPPSAASAARARSARRRPRLLAPIAGRATSRSSGRRLFPQEDKLAVEKMRAGAKLDELVAFIGHLLGAGARARRRGARRLPAPRPWTGDGGRRPWSITPSSSPACSRRIYLAYARRNALNLRRPRCSSSPPTRSSSARPSRSRRSSALRSLVLFSRGGGSAELALAVASFALRAALGLYLRKVQGPLGQAEAPRGPVTEGRAAEGAWRAPRPGADYPDLLVRGRCHFVGDRPPEAPGLDSSVNPDPSRARPFPPPPHLARSGPEFASAGRWSP